MRIAQNVTEVIGSTPLVKLGPLNRTGADVLVKLEARNPGGSVKDRVALAIVEAAVASGKLVPGGTIVEATSGNTGIGLAMVGAALGYQVKIVMPASMSVERRALMKFYGAELVLTEPAGGMAAAVAEAEKIVAETPGAVLASQFDNPANPAKHYATTAEEIWADTEGKVDVLVAGIGTGGSVSGIGKRLKELNPNIRVIGVEPAESALITEGQAGPHGIQGIGANFVPENLNMEVIDEVRTIPTDSALATSRALARQEGMLVGISSGAAVAAALEVACSEGLEGQTIVVIAPDTGERYLSTTLFEHVK